MVRFRIGCLLAVSAVIVIVRLVGMPERPTPAAALEAAPPASARSATPSVTSTPSFSSNRAFELPTRTEMPRRAARGPAAADAGADPATPAVRLLDVPIAGLAPPRAPGVPVSRMTIVIACEMDEMHEGLDSNADLLQQCIDIAPDGGIVEIPAGIYPLRRQVVVGKPLTIRTARSTDGSVRCTTTPEGCARFVASPDFRDELGLLVVSATHDVTLEHLVLDGNRDARVSSPAAQACRQGRTAAGYTASVIGCTKCALRDVLAHRTLCGTALYWMGAQASIDHNRFEENGDAGARMWSDGLTAVYAPESHIYENQFYENTDVGLILGYGLRTRIEDNHIRQRNQAAFAGLMLDNFNSDDLRNRGDFRGAEITDNVIDCRPYRCAFGIQVGPRPWYPTRNIIGGQIWNNEVYGAKVGINVDGAGRPDAPIRIFSNRVTDVADGSRFATCAEPIAADWMNIAPTSVVYRGDETTRTGTHLSDPCQLWSPLGRADE